MARKSAYLSSAAGRCYALSAGGKKRPEIPKEETKMKRFTAWMLTIALMLCCAPCAGRSARHADGKGARPDRRLCLGRRGTGRPRCSRRTTYSIPRLRHRPGRLCRLCGGARRGGNADHGGEHPRL